MNNAQDLTGVFLYYEGTEYSEAAAFLENWQPTAYWGKIRGVPTNFQIVSGLVPKEVKPSQTFLA